MKKLVFFLTAVLFTAISANVYAQGTGIQPEIGSVHNYSVAPGTANGNTYTWSVTSDAAGIVPVAATVAALSSNGGTDVSAIDITWLAPTPATNYYVHVLEIDDHSGGTGCQNRKVLTVNPVNNFTLLFVTTQDDNTDNAIDTEWKICPPDVVVSSYDGATPPANLAGAQLFTYDYGTSYLYYHITASGLNTATTTWTPSVTATIATALDAQVVNASWGTYDGTDWTEAEADNDISTADVIDYTVDGSGEVWLRLEVIHTTTYEGTSSEDITLLITAKDENLNPVTDVNNKGAISDSELQTIKGRPATINIITTE